MNFRLTILIAAALVVACSSSARAGFLTADPFVVAEFRDNAASGTPVDDESLPTVPWVQQHQRKALANAPANSGMSGAAGISGPSHAPAAALPVVLPDTSAQLSARLCVEERAWLPPPFSTGVFRPPRG